MTKSQLAEASMSEFVYKLYTRWDFISLETMAKFKWEDWHVIVMDFKNIKVYFTMSSKYTKNIIATCYEFKKLQNFHGTWNSSYS